MRLHHLLVRSGDWLSWKERGWVVSRSLGYLEESRSLRMASESQLACSGNLGPRISGSQPQTRADIWISVLWGRRELELLRFRKTESSVQAGCLGYRRTKREADAHSSRQTPVRFGASFTALLTLCSIHTENGRLWPEPEKDRTDHSSWGLRPRLILSKLLHLSGLFITISENTPIGRLGW